MKLGMGKPMAYNDKKDSKFSPRQIKFLELYLSGFLMKDACDVRTPQPQWSATFEGDLPKSQGLWHSHFCLRGLRGVTEADLQGKNARFVNFKARWRIHRHLR